jgi:hypothetical protein
MVCVALDALLLGIHELSRGTRKNMYMLPDVEISTTSTAGAGLGCTAVSE